MTKRSTLEKFFAVIAKEFRIWFCKFVGQANWFAFKRDKVLFKCGLREKLTEALAQDDIQTLVERDKSGVKCGVVKRRETKTISRIQTLDRKFAPRFNVARNQQAWNIDAADTAANIISIENRLPEELLSATNFDCRLGFCRPAGCDEPNFISCEEIHLFRFIFREQVVKNLLTFRAKHRGMLAEFFPHFFILLGRTFQSFDPTSALNRIKRRKIAKLHRETVCIAAHLVRDFDNYWVRMVKLAEGKFAVKIEGYERMLARPFDCWCFCHAARLSDPWEKMKRKTKTKL